MGDRVSSILVSLGFLLLLSFSFDIVGARPAHAQDRAGPAEADGPEPTVAEPEVPEKAGKELRAYRITGNAPQIDGVLDEEVWLAADPIDDLVQGEPDNMEPPTERTVVRVAYDDGSIYVAIYNYMRDPSQITTGLGRRDNLPPSDQISINFDPRHDHLTGYTFVTNPSGVQRDYTWFDDNRSSNDYSGVWEVATRITADGWTAEFQIPLSQMRFNVPPVGEMVWGFQVRRNLYRRAEFDQWVPRPRGDQGTVSRWGHLVFEDRVSPPRRLEFLPYTFVRREDLPTRSPEHTASAGFDVRLGLGTSATLSGTINPDFAQVELDPAVLNLTVFESFFPERRPFFLEDSQTFRLQYRQFPMFHSRRIGRRPGRFPLEPGDRLVSRPDQTTILGAAKVTGKASGWTYGVLSALTAREYATVDAVTVDGSGAETLTRVDRLIEPRTSYSVARIQRDILGGSSNVGAIGTATVREQDADAITGGVDYNLRWGRNLYQFAGHWVGTHAPFPEGQRTGFGGETRFSYFGKYFGFDGFFQHFSPNFRNTDLGFKRGRVDVTATNGSFFFRQPDPWLAFRRVQLFVGGGGRWNTSGLELGSFVGTGLSLSFKNFWQFNANINRNFRALDDLDTRGGPAIVTPATSFFGVNVGTDTRKRWRLFMGFFGNRDEEGGWNLSVGPNLNFQPSARLQASLSMNYSFGKDVAQWVTNQDVTANGQIDYVYGRLRQDVINITGRVTYAFHRDLTLEVFLQPFVAVGHYSNFGRLARPRSFEFEPVAIPFNPDFNSKSLRGNVVLRWEYLRGSTIFLVWNMSTFDGSRPGEFSPWEDLSSAFTADGANVFMLKMNYWFGV